MKKISKPISLFLALILTVSCFTGLSVTTVSADGDGQRIYFQYPTDGTWGDPQGVKISSRTGLANVYCYPRVIYGETGFSPPNNAPERLFQCRSEGNDIYSFDLSVFGEIEEDIDYGVRFSTKANGDFQTVELTMNSDCLGKTVSLTPYEGAVYRTNDEDNNRQDFYAAWEHNTGCGPKAAISSHGEFLPGLFPFYQPKEQILSDALRKWLVDTASNSYFQLNNMVLCESLAVSPEQVYNQYVADNEDFIDACGGSVQTSDDVPCPYITDGTTKIASPEYVRTVLGIVDEDYTAAGSPQSFFGTEWDATNTSNDLHYNESTALYEITYQNAQPADSVSFKIVKNHSWGEGAYPDNNFIFKIESECDVTITFDPNTCEVNATGDGVRIIDELEAYSVIAVGNGEDTYLNGVNWDPSDTSNSLTEISDGIWEMTMEDIYAFDNYNVKFAINSIDREGNPTPNPWTYNFGSETERVYPTGEELNAVWNGGSCIFEVDEDGSTVILRLDLRDFDFVNKTGAKMMITVIPPVDDQDALYEIVISTEGLGTARADHGLARKGETVILTALPEDGWHFKEWWVLEGDIEITDDSFVMPGCDVKILALFEECDYSIEIESEGGGDAYAIPERADHGDLVFLSAQPYDGWRFKEWQVIEGAFEITNDSFEMPDWDVKILAVFEKCDYSIEIESEGGGYATAYPERAHEADSVELCPFPDEGWRFKEWQVLEGDIEITGDFFTMPGCDVKILAVFEVIPDNRHDINITSSGGGMAYADNYTSEQGERIALYKEPDEGWHFREWQVLEGDVEITDDYFVMPDCDVKILAVFEECDYSIEIESEGEGFAFTISQRADEGYPVFLFEFPEDGWRFKEWQVIEGDIEITDNTFTMPAGNVKILAVFEAIPDNRHDINVTVSGSGTAYADNNTAEQGGMITLYAEPEDGWRFKEWQVIEGDVEITNNSFIMPDNDVEILAVFERVYSIISGDDMTVAYHWVGWEEEIVKEAAPGEEFGVILIDGSKPEKGNYFTGEFTLNGKSLGKVTGSGATWYITEFVMPECDVTLAAVQARQETLTVDLIDSEAVEIDSKAAFQINRDIEMDYDDASHVPLIDLNENGTPDISYTIVDEYDEEGVNIIDVHFYIKRLDSCDAWGSYSYSFKENDDRFSRITFRTSNRGDVDCNGVVNIIDATMIQKHLAGLITLEGDALENADADGNGIVDINDVTAVQKHIAHLI